MQTIIGSRMKLIELKEAKEAKVSVPTFPIVSKNIDGREKEWFDNSIKKLAFFIKEKELTATELKDNKEGFNRGIQGAYTEFINAKYFHGGKGASLPDGLRYDLDIQPAAHKTAGQLKKIAKFKKKYDHKILEDIEKFLKEIEDFSAKVAELKGMVVKKKRAEVEKKEAANATAKDILSHKDVKKVRKVLIQITQDVRADVEKAYAREYKQYLDVWKEQYEPGDRKTNVYVAFSRNPHVRQIVGSVVKEGKKRYEEEVDKKWKSIFKKRAAKAADDMLEHFILKNTEKLGRIVAAKDNMKSITIGNVRTEMGVVEGGMDIAFKDKSKFTVINKVVSSYSKNGKPFYRFPTTFHNVKMSDGNKLGNPSEAKMKAEFIS